MAKKRAEKPTMPVATEPKTKAVRLDLEEDLHQKLRVVAAEKGKPMAIFAREVVEKVVRELYGRRGLK
jgi:predicted DNA-binding protein